MKSSTVSISDIRCDSGTQSRLSISENAVAEYCERMTAGDEFPPLDVFFDGNEYHLADGFHRTLAAERAGIKVFPCNVHKGTVQDAIWFSIGANGKNGERRTPSDKRNCIEIALSRFPDKSQEQIAEHVGCNQSTVQRVQSELMQAHKLSVPTERKGKDGKSRPTSYKPRKPKAAATSAPEPEPEPQSSYPEPEPTPPSESKPENPVTRELDTARHSISALLGMIQDGNADFDNYMVAAKRLRSVADSVEQFAKTL